MTLMEREPSYVDKMTYEIEMIFRENPDSVLLFWILTFLKEEYIPYVKDHFKNIFSTSSITEKSVSKIIIIVSVAVVAVAIIVVAVLLILKKKTPKLAIADGAEEKKVKVKKSKPKKEKIKPVYEIK